MYENNMIHIYEIKPLFTDDSITDDKSDENISFV